MAHDQHQHQHHDHDHDHDHDHPHPAGAAADLGPAFRWAVGLNLGYVLVEAVAGFMVGSLALLADAAHNLTDVAGLLLAWAATAAARKPPTDRHTYGYGRSTILAALGNAIAILVGVGAVIWEASQRFAAPVVVPALPVLLVAGGGILVNAGTALLFGSHRHHDLNARGAYLHMAADAAVSAGVVLSALALLATGWTWLDPLAAILVSLLIAFTAYGLLKSALGLSLDGVPATLERPVVEAWLRSLPGVDAVHDLHIWSLSTTSTALTAHLVIPAGHPGDAFLQHAAAQLEQRYGIGHATLQIETGQADCRLAPADVV